MDFKIGITSEDYARLAAFTEYRNARHPDQAMSVSDMGTLLFHHIINLSYVISDVSNSEFGITEHADDCAGDGDDSDDNLGGAIIV